MNDEILAESINDLIGGGGICFIGAGFSMEARDANGMPVPSVKQLCEEICKFPGLEGEVGESLSDLTDFCNSSIDLKYRLSALLTGRLTLCQPTSAQRKILSMPWRAVFTTNFDDVAEQAIPQAQRTVVTPVYDAAKLQAAKKTIYYLHGRARDVLDGAVDPSIVLSETNYLDLKERNRNLYAALENEVHAATRIVLIGYSARDTEIASRLFSIAGLKEKCVVICGPDETQVGLQRLKKFGTVIPIGTEVYAQKLPDDPDSLRRENDTAFLSFVKQVSPEAAKAEVELSDVERLLLTGEFSYSAYAAQEREHFENPSYMIPRRAHIDTVFGTPTINRFVVSSDLGNGKTALLEQISFRAHQLGFEVFKIDTQLIEILPELDALMSSPTRRLYIVDGLVRHRRIVQHIGKRLPGNSLLVVSSGQYLDNNDFGLLSSELGGATREIDLNLLNSQELGGWNDFLERWGFWEGRIEESTAERLRFLKERCGSENRSVVIALFRGSKLTSKIDGIVNFFLRTHNQFSKAFIAVLINALCQKHVEWSRLVAWLRIDEQAFKNAVIQSPVGDFMSGSKRWFEFTSTELADHILNSYEFNTAEIVETYTEIVRQTAFSANDPRTGFDAKENLKELMRYRFLTRLFSKQVDGPSSINAVYHRLSNVQRIRENDQFWLQYAMARMEVNDLQSAETYLGTAIGLANKKGVDYSKRQITDQQARLLFRKNARVFREREVEEAIELLTEAVSDKTEPVVHPLRSAEHILGFLEARADLIKPPLASALRDLLRLMKSKMPEGRLEKSQKGETEVIRKNVRDCLLIIDNL